jgi:hypothetical protein
VAPGRRRPLASLFRAAIDVDIVSTLSIRSVPTQTETAVPHDPARFARRAAFRKMAAATVLAVVAAATITVGQPAFTPAVTAPMPGSVVTIEMAAVDSAQESR